MRRSHHELAEFIPSTVPSAMVKSAISAPRDANNTIAFCMVFLIIGDVPKEKTGMCGTEPGRARAARSISYAYSRAAEPSRERRGATPERPRGGPGDARGTLRGRPGSDPGMPQERPDGIPERLCKGVGTN